MASALRCTQTAVSETGERIFAVEDDGISTGGMLESELRSAAELAGELDAVSGGTRLWRETKRMIDDALAAPPRHFTS